MKQRTLLFCAGLAVILVAGGLSAQTTNKSLSIGQATGHEVTLPIMLSSDEDVQGFVVSAEFDTSKLEATDVRAAGATLDNNAELVVPEILPGEGFTLGVVMDFEEPWDGQVIPAGQDVLIGEVDLSALTIPAEEEVVEVSLVDGLNDPPLNNILVVGGMSIGAAEGLGLTDVGEVTVPRIVETIRIAETTGAEGQNMIPVPVEVDNQKAVEGYVLSVQSPTDVVLDEITTAGTDAGAVGIEFETAKTYADGGTLGVVFDFDSPYDGQTLAPGEGQTLAKYVYKLDPPLECVPAGEDPMQYAETYSLAFVDDYFGDPKLSNLLVEGGMSVFPDKVDGSVTFVPELCPPPVGVDFYVGGDVGEAGPEGECDGADIPDAMAAPGGEAKVTLYYSSDQDPIQGLSMGLSYPAELSVKDLDGSGQGMVSGRHLAGTVTEGIGAEFVSFNADNEAGELIVGILVDSTPPIPVSHMYPASSCPRKVLNVYFDIPEDGGCDACYDLAFEEGLTGAGNVEISNVASIFNESVEARTHDGKVCAAPVPVFVRGDCNWDTRVDIADPAATMCHLFLNAYDPECMDACDSNDDGVVDVADVCSTLRFLFQLGPELPAPGPYDAGPDPTEDAFGLDLGCEAGNPCD